MTMRLQRGAFACILSAFCAFAACATSSAEEWNSIGPIGTLLSNNDVISGQMAVIAVDPRDANILYVGASEGGVWKTSDGGVHWIALTDTQLVRKTRSGKSKGTLSIGSLTIDPVNPQTVYVGTGDVNVATDVVGPGLGVFRSTDGGATWIPTGADLFQAGCQNDIMSERIVAKMLVVPGNPAVVFGTTDSGLFRYKEDGSDCWMHLTNGLPNSGQTDLVVDPYQGALYVAYWKQGIYKSTDLSGSQWTKLAGGLPTSNFNRIALAFGGRTGVGFSQPLPLVYAGFSATPNGNESCPTWDPNEIYRLFVTKDGGGTWSELPCPPSENQLNFGNTIAVGPFSSDEVYIGQVDLWKATDGGRKGGTNNYKVNPPVEGNSWTTLSCCLSNPNPLRKNLDLHADLHDIVFAPYGSFLPSPSQVQIVYVANDGGVTKGSFDSDGVVTWVPLTRGLVVGQSGTIGLDPWNVHATASGFWHNGSILTVSGFANAFPFGGGDGFQTTIDADGVTIYFNCNAGIVGGEICRATSVGSPPAISFNVDTIWSNQSRSAMWSDPHRPGQLLRLQHFGKPPLPETDLL
jgi:photosystem II stability/assembly factor-like uncharacterized protein